MSLRARLLAATLVLVALGLVVANIATYSALRSFLYDRVDSQLEAVHRSVDRVVPARRDMPPEPALRRLEAVTPGVFAQVRDPQGRVVASSAGRRFGVAPTSAPRLPDDLDGSPRVLTAPAVEDGGPRYRVRVAPLRNGSTLVAALPLDETQATLRRLLMIELFVSLAVFAAAAGAGLWLVRLGLRPLADIEATAASITAGDMSHRVEHDDERTEVGRLGRSLNVMLDRIDTAFAERQASEEAARASEQRVRRFVGDASHELRTPVAAVRAYAELYRMGADQHPEDLARVLARIEQEAARMGALVDDLLLLTRLDEGRPLDRQPVDLGAVAADAVAAARAVEPDRPIDVDVAGSVEVLGDRYRLRQVVDNLLANVRAHTPRGSPAAVRVASNGDGDAVLEVADRGPGLDVEQAAHVFERFYRADAARSRDSGGAGLGLSIVAAIVDAHGGEAFVDARDGGGSVFRVQLPAL
ncbi:MAG: HAMP domain-containing protein [Actinobacteria bacterium]|nr:HAMP domain-containing protein [Actinomycetota bacterium]